MGSIAVFPDPTHGRVRLEPNWQDIPGANQAWIYRRIGAGPQVPVRGCGPIRLSHGLQVVYDTEAQLDVSLQYRTAVAYNANGTFEEGVGEWTATPTVGTVTQEFGFYAPTSPFLTPGVASLKLVNTTGAVTSLASSEEFAAVAATNYTISGRLMVPSAWAGGIGVQISWYNAAHGLISTVGAANDFAPIPGTWGTYGFSSTAPALTAFARIWATFTGTPPLTLPLYVDEMFLTNAATTVDSAVTLVSGEGNGWWKDPLHPAVDTRLLIVADPGCALDGGVYFVSLADKGRPADGVALEINDQPEALTIWSKRKAVRSTVRVVTRTFPDRDQVAALHASGAPLFLQLPDIYGEPDTYMTVGETAEGRLGADHRVQWRVQAAPFTTVRAPVGPAEGVYGERYQDLTLYDTFTDITAAGKTWVDVLQGEAGG